MHESSGGNQPAESGTTPMREWTLTSRRCGVAILCLAAVALISHVASDRWFVGAACKVFFPTLLLGVVPGFLIAVARRRGASWGLAELAGVSLILSLALAQIPTLIGLILHVPTIAVTFAWVGLFSAAGLVLCRSKQTIVSLTADHAELAILLGVLAVASLAYVKGSPFFSDEEQIHVSIIRRIAHAPAPGPDNIYPAKDVVYTHPFPGTHYFMAMVSQLGGIDALFVYNKLRWYWTAATLVFLYALAKVVFGPGALARATAVTGIALALNGSFADFSTLYWGQLLPFSHPSDVAMSVLLPGLLLVTFLYYTCPDQDSTFFFGSTVLAVAMLTIVHIRETVQFLVYNGCFLLVTVAYSWDRRRAWRIVALTLVATLLTGAYGLFHHHFVSHVAQFDAAYKAELAALFKAGTFRSLILEPLRDASFYTFFWGWTALILAASPLVCLAFRSRPLVLFMGMSIFVYLLLVRVSLFSIVYTYCTYCEMLMSPVRNISFFLYLMTGPLLYLIAHTLARLGDRAISGAIAISVAVGIGYLAHRSWAFWMPYVNMIIVGTILLYVALGALLKLLGFGESPSETRVSSRPGTLLPIVLLGSVLTSAEWDRSPFAINMVATNAPFFSNHAPIFWTPRQLVASLQPILTDQWDLGRSNGYFADYHYVVKAHFSFPVPMRLIRWAAKELPADAVVAGDSLSVYPLPMFLPQQVPAWPLIVSCNLCYPRVLVPEYFRLYDQAMATHQAQPFFNQEESLSERLNFLKTIKATHVVLDPQRSLELKSLLQNWPEHFETIYDEADWVVLRVHYPNVKSE